MALVSPAYWVPEEVILQAAETLRAWGLQPVIGPHTASLNVKAYSGTADERASDLLWALEDDSIKAVGLLCCCTLCTQSCLNKSIFVCCKRHSFW